MSASGLCAGSEIPIASDSQKLKHLEEKYGFTEACLVGKYPTPEFQVFFMGGV
jgi:hypothetical protein